MLLVQRKRWWKRIDPIDYEATLASFSRTSTTITIDSSGQPTASGVTISKVRTGRYKLDTGASTDIIYAIEGWISDGLKDYYLNVEDSLGVASGVIYLNVREEILPTENDLTVSRAAARLIYHKNSADASAATTLAERPIAHVPGNWFLSKITFTPDDTAAAHASNFATITVGNRNRGGGSNTIGTWSTSSSAQGSLTAGVSASFVLGSATVSQVFADSVILLTIAKSGSGVVIPSGVFDLFFTIMNRNDGILAVPTKHEWFKDADDVLAVDTTAERPVFRVVVPCALGSAGYVANANITANGTNFGTSVLSKYDNAGANETNIANLATSSSGVTANLRRTASTVSTEASRLRSGDIIAWEITKTAAGVVFPAGIFDLSFNQLTFGFPRSFQFDADDAAANTTISEFPIFIAPEARTLNSGWYIGNAAIATDATDYAVMTFSRRDGAGGGATTLTSYSTQTGQNGATVTNVPALFTNSVTSVPVGNILTFQTTKGGAGKIIRAGVALVHWSAETIRTDGWLKYSDDALASDTLSAKSFFCPKRTATVSALKICLKTTIAADATDYVVFTVTRKDAFNNCSETLGTWSTQTGQNGAITAMIPVSMTLTTDTPALTIAPGDNLYISYTKAGAGKIVSQGVVQVDYTIPSSSTVGVLHGTLIDVPADPISRTIYLDWDKRTS